MANADQFKPGTSSDVVSPPIKLNPGFSFRGQRITEAEVKLLPRAQRKAIAKHPPEEQGDLFLLRSISRLGHLTDPQDIAEAFEFILAPDEERLTQALNDLRAEYSEAPKPEQPKIKRVVLPTDEVSQPFGLNPGINVAGREIKSCVVRLLRRGELKQIEAIADEMEQADMSLWLSIVQLGDLTDVTLEHVDLLTLADEERINKEIAELRDSFRPGPRHECPECGHKF
jgi:hypothetical protein